METIKATMDAVKPIDKQAEGNTNDHAFDCNSIGPIAADVWKAYREAHQLITAGKSFLSSK